MEKEEGKHIEEWNKLTDEIVKQFLSDYFEDNDFLNVTLDWEGFMIKEAYLVMQSEIIV